MSGTFVVGEKVKWSSQASGFTKEKVGTVVAVVPAGDFVRDHIPAGCMIDSTSSTRNHDSYLVRVGKRRKLYWPLVKYLSKVEPVTEGSAP